MTTHPIEDDIGSLERARESLYSTTAPVRDRGILNAMGVGPVLPRAWEEKKLPRQRVRHVRVASIFFGVSIVFFLIALGVAGYFFYFGGNAVSVDKVAIAIQGPTTIAGGDTVPLSLSITNKNPAEIENATIEIDFPEGTRNATNVQTPYPRYVENLGTLASGATITRSIKAVMFGGAGQTLSLPVSFSYSTASSNAIFEKKSSYEIAISSTPLSVSVDALSETVSGAPITFTVVVRSNATVPLDNIVLTETTPFGFSASSSSIPINNSTLFIGTLAPGASKQVTITGTLTGQDSEQRVFHFTVGTAKSAQDQTLAVAYMTQDATVSIASPFIATKLAVNGDTSGASVLAPGSRQSVSLSYTNTLSTPISDASVVVAIAGAAIDYDSIRTTSGFYNSSNHTILFSKDTDPSLAMLAPGASGLGTFTFSTTPAGIASPTVTFGVMASGTRLGQSNVPERVTTSATTIQKVSTAVLFQAHSIYLSGPLPLTANQTTSYTIFWDVQNKGNAIAGGVASATLPSYVSYVGVPSGSGSFSYNNVSHVLTWNVGDIAQGGSAEGTFQVSVLPSTSQKGNIISLTSSASFSAHDRFAGVQVSASANPATTDAAQSPGYVDSDGIVH